MHVRDILFLGVQMTKAVPVPRKLPFLSSDRHQTLILFEMIQEQMPEKGIKAFYLAGRELVRTGQKAEHKFDGKERLKQKN